MNQLKSPITRQLILLFLLISLILAGSVFIAARQQISKSAVAGQLSVMSDHALAYAKKLEANPDEQQVLTANMSTLFEGESFYLIAPDGTYLTHSNPDKIGQSAGGDFSSSTLEAFFQGSSTSLLDEKTGKLAASYRASPTGPVSVVVGKPPKENSKVDILTRELQTQSLIAFVISTLLGAAAILLTLSPLHALANYANEVAAGNLNFRFDDRKLKGELATLSFNLRMLAANARSSIASLENRVNERTRQLEHRSKLSKAVADVGKAITSFRDLSELLQQTAYLIHENFGYYHVGIFLLDEHKEYAVLSASNSDGGRRMLEKQHRLKVGEVGIVGYVTQNAKARIALDVGKDAVYFDNPDLPQTRSEMALPLIVGGQMLGALDVQSTEPQAFSEEDVSTLQILAEQIAIAIQNANLFDEAEKAIESARMGYAELSRGAWNKLLRTQQRIGFLATTPATVPISSDQVNPNLARAFETGTPTLESDGLTIILPVRVRGQVIGAVRLKKTEISEAWTQEETNLAISLSDQLGGALESARLYKESQQHAARETLISDISARINAVSQTDFILRETVQELGQVIGNASVTFQLLDQPNNENAPGTSEENPDTGRKSQGLA